MNTPKNNKKKWEIPMVFDLDVKNTNSGTLTTFLESTVTASGYPFFAPSS